MHRAAQQDSRSIESVVEEAMTGYLTMRHADLTPAQIERLQQSLAQADSGGRFAGKGRSVLPGMAIGDRFAVTRFSLTKHAMDDLDEIRRYAEPIPKRSADKVLKRVQQLLLEVAEFPQRGMIASFATRALGQEVRSHFDSPYRVFYRDLDKVVEILGILHVSRDIEVVMSRRLQ